MSELNNIDLDLLPKNLRDIAEIIGIKSTMKLVEAFGGTRIYIRDKFGRDNRLINVIGITKAKQVWEMYRGEHLMIDKAESALRELRNMEIYNKLYTHTAAELAIEYQLTEASIYSIRRKYQGQDDQQLKLL